MPVFFQQDINDHTRLGIWKIEEDDSFFKQWVPLHREVTHPHKRLQHLAGRFLLKYLFPDFPSQQVQIADTRKPFLLNEAFHFSISHCGDYAAAIVSRTSRVGIDIEIPAEKVLRVKHKFISTDEQQWLQPLTLQKATQVWSAKEAVYKWYGEGLVDFKQHIQLKGYKKQDTFSCYFSKSPILLDIHLAVLPPLCLSFVYATSS